MTRELSLETKRISKPFLKEAKQIKSLREECRSCKCAIRELLLEEDFDQHDQDVQNRLLKIQNIDGLDLNKSDCFKLLKLLPNLKGFGLYQELAPFVSHYIDDDYVTRRLYNLTEIYDIQTSLRTLGNFIKLCPKVKCVRESRYSPGLKDITGSEKCRCILIG